MQANPKFKPIEESFEGHEAGATNGISRNTVIEAVEQSMDEVPDEPTKEHHIQLAGDLPGFDEGAGASASLEEPPAPKQGKTIVFPNKKEKKPSGGGMKKLFAKFGGVNKKMIFGGLAGVAFLGVAGFAAYEFRAMHQKVERLSLRLERMRTDVQRAGADAGGGVQAAQIGEALNGLNHKLVSLDQRLAVLEQAPAPQPAAPVAAAPARAAKKVAAKAKPADRQIASVKKAKPAKKRR